MPVARATAADLSMLRIPPPRCVGGGLTESGGGCSCKCLCACVCVCVCMCGFPFVLCVCTPAEDMIFLWRTENSGFRYRRVIDQHTSTPAHHCACVCVCVGFLLFFVFFCLKNVRILDTKSDKIRKDVHERPLFPTCFRHFRFRFVFGRFGVPKWEGT